MPKEIKKTRQDYYLLLDRSGSMSSIAGDVIGGVNQFVDDQKKITEDEMRFNLIQFDGSDPFEVIQDGVDISDVTPLTSSTYIPRGSTPLLDAVGKTIAKAKGEIKKRSKVTVVIVTDGQENASREYDNEAIREAIKTAEEAGWIFVFIGANQDSFATARSIGSQGSATLDFFATDEGVRGVFATASASNLAYRSSTIAGQSLGAADYLVDSK